MILLNPNRHVSRCTDERSREIMARTVEFFESKGLRRLKADDRERVWYADFLEFLAREQVFSTLLTPAAYGGVPGCRWDNWRNNEFNEILAFYGLHYWYTWQVTILGLGPIWMSANEAVSSLSPAPGGRGGSVWTLRGLAQATPGCGGLRDAARQEGYTRAGPTTGVRS